MATTREHTQEAPSPLDQAETAVYGDFVNILKPSSHWVFGGFSLPDGGFWCYQEPDAVVVVQDGRLRVTAMPLTRSNDRVQILDNAKHMYFSRERILVPKQGAIQFDLSIAARVYRGLADDLYGGFVSFNLLDFSSGFAVDFFVSNDRIATVYGRLPFPGAPLPHTGAVRYFCIFKELEVATAAGQRHDYQIVYDSCHDRIEWDVDGNLVNAEEDVPDKLEGFTLAMGLMTEKEIGAQGSTSLHGQGIQGDWSPTTIRRTVPPDAEAQVPSESKEGYLTPQPPSLERKGEQTRSTN
ncbi:MAG: DUF6081 family protein [Dehalococcoidia bacterium]